MDTIFTLNDEDLSDKISLDDLYEKKKIFDMSKLSVYNKILNRIHIRIKTVSRQKIDEQHCWFIVPEMIIGVPKYDHSSCIAYLVDKLNINGFVVNYTHPNLLFISWKHWVPSYVRTEIKKKTGIVIDGYGNKIEKKDEKEEPGNVDELMYQHKNIKIPQNAKKDDKDYKTIDSYKPTGNLIYNTNLLKKIETKFSS